MVSKKHSLLDATVLAATFATTVSLPLPILAQDFDPMAAAADALIGVDGLGTITDDNLNDVVEPFETTSPPEADLTNATIENEITDRRARGDTIEAETFSDLETSAASRPEYDFETDDPIITRTEAITDGAGDTVGDLFTSNGEGVCELDEFEGTPLIDTYCERSQEYSQATCNETLDITLDRADSWRCIQIPEVYPQTCEQRVNITCNNPANCLVTSLNYSVNAPEYSGDYPDLEGYLNGNPGGNPGTLFTENSYKAEISGTTVTFKHLLYNGPQNVNVFSSPSPFLPITRSMSFSPPDSGVNYTSIQMDIYWEVNNYKPADCTPDLIINGGQYLLDGNIVSNYSHSGPFPCMAGGSILLNNQTQPQGPKYTIQKRTFELLPYLLQPGDLTIDITANGWGMRSIVMVFRLTGGCCLNPDITYENMSCE